jgi:hypothetical protein
MVWCVVCGVWCVVCGLWFRAWYTQVAKQTVELGHVGDGATLEVSQGDVTTATATGVLVHCLGVSLQ